MDTKKRICLWPKYNEENYNQNNSVSWMSFVNEVAKQKQGSKCLCTFVDRITNAVKSLPRRFFAGAVFNYDINYIKRKK